MCTAQAVCTSVLCVAVCTVQCAVFSVQQCAAVCGRVQCVAVCSVQQCAAKHLQPGSALAAALLQSAAQRCNTAAQFAVVEPRVKVCLVKYAKFGK